LTAIRALGLAVRAVNVRHDGMDLGHQLLHLLAPTACGVRNLDENRLAAQLRMRLQQGLECAQFQLQAFEHIQVVHAYKHRLACELSHQLATAPDGLRPLRQAASETLRVDACGADFDGDFAARVVDAEAASLGLVHQAQHA